MKLFVQYLYSRRHVLFCALFCAAAYGVIFFLYGIDMQAVWYPLLICLFFAALFMLSGYFHMKKRHLELGQISRYDGVFEECLPPASNLIEEDYQAMIARLEEKNRKEKESQELAKKDMQDYYARWVHQIKAPIAVMQVLLQREDTQENQELRSELFRVEQYVDMALCYTRLGEGGSDLLFQEYDLDEIIRKAIRKYAGQFIRKKIRLVYKGTDEKVVTDEKWLSFIIEQLLSNAVKYTAQGTVTIAVDKKKRLTVSDTGIGISPEDLPRIFEKGYTGYNGRQDKKSTGIGLYLCKKLCEKMGHRIEIVSARGRGCMVIIRFPLGSMTEEIFQ